MDSANVKKTYRTMQTSRKSTGGRPPRRKPVVPRKVNSPKRESKPFSEMVNEAVMNSKDHRGASNQAISTYIKKTFAIGYRKTENNANIRDAIRKAVESGTLIQTSGTGVRGRFKIAG